MRSSLAIYAFLHFIRVCVHAQGQNSSAIIDQLNNAGYTSFASALEKANGTQEGQNLLSQLNNGNYTIIAPDNQAFDSPEIQNASNDPQALANILSYHVLPGNFVNSSVNASALDSGVQPNNTVGRTLLTNSSEVQLEGGKPQALAWTRNDSDGQIYFLNQNPPVHVLNTTNVGNNILLATTDGVLMPPGNTSTVLAQNNLTGVQALLNMVSVPAGNGSNITATSVLDSNSTHGYTLFAPSNEALQNAGSSLSSLSNNQTALLAVLQNHYINGTTYYSPELVGVNSTSSTNSSILESSSSPFVSAAGENLGFNTNSSGSFVTSSNGASAKIVKSDILTENGVIHEIDNVLVNPESDPSRASAAFESATSAAAQSTTQTGPIGPLPTSSGSTNSTSNRTSGAPATAHIQIGSLWILLLAIVGGVLACA
ncbi:hypothetical protein H0H92_015128 [Tricholoma furcatifolium]|nr:hypothetical protein H0H92_015128 [Tricholoma furcatifolium]